MLILLTFLLASKPDASLTDGCCLISNELEALTMLGEL
jgi:hypothetical protein